MFEAKLKIGQEASEDRESLQEVERINFSKLHQVEAYKLWKDKVPAGFRRVVEAHLKGFPYHIPKEYTPVIASFLNGVQQCLQNPTLEVEDLNLDIRAKNIIKRLQAVSHNEGSFVNIFEVLRRTDISFDQKLKWYEAEVVGRLNWLQAQDVPDESDEKSELLPSGDNDKLKPSMDELSESKEEVKEGFYEISPHYGGYYKAHIYEKWDPQTLEWSKADKELKRAGNHKLIPETSRIMRGVFEVGKYQPIDLPYNFGIETLSLEVPEGLDAEFFQDQDGIYYLKVQPKQESELNSDLIAENIAKSVEIEFKIGKYQNIPQLQSEPLKETLPEASLPPEVRQKILDAKMSNLPSISKAKILCSFIRNNLEYSNDSSCNDLYQANPSQYFEAIWTNKKADCDVANTFAAEVLRQAGLKVRMVVGHYAKSPTKRGTTLLHGGTGHAWLEVFDEEEQVWRRFGSPWERMDATPKGDPNMDEEEQEEDLKDQPNEGDFGEQEAELMGDEQLEELKEKLKAKEEQKQEAEQTPEAVFAKEASCTPEEARAVLQKIKQLRELKDQQGRSVLERSKRTWLNVMKKNFKSRTIYTGPVRKHEGEDLVDPVGARISSKVGEKRNPEGYEKRTQRVEVEKYFGGFEVYLAVDRSGSMNDVDPKTGKPKKEAQRDCVFLMVDSMMSNALEVKRNERNLKAPMPVKICVVAFGEVTEVIFPLTDKWGPAEQIKLYRALNAMAGGGTPDDEALAVIQTLMTASKEQEADLKKQKKLNPSWDMHRFIGVFADGGSNNQAISRQKAQDLRSDGTVLFGFGVTASGRAMEAVYAPNAVTIEDTNQLAEVGVNTLVDTVKEWYNI